MIKYRLPNNEEVDGRRWTVIGGHQYQLSRMSDAELASINVEKFDDAPAQTIENMRSDLKRRVAAERWSLQVGGISVQGMQVRTDEYTQMMLSTAYFRAAQDPDFVVQNWRMSDGTYITLNKAVIDALYLAVEAHIEGLFDQNKIIDDQISALTSIEEAAQFTWSFE